MILELSATHVRRQCPVCPGTGRRMQERPGGVTDYLPCPTCRGTGDVTVPRHPAVVKLTAETKHYLETADRILYGRPDPTADPGLGVRLVYSDFTGGL